MDSFTTAQPEDADFVQRLRQELQRRTGGCVTLVETHISWLFLAGRLAFKLKKPVRLPFLDFSTPALRWHFCAEEIRLNRRLCASLYRGLVAVRRSRAEPAIGGAGPIIDALVCMRRFPDDAVLSARLAAGRLTPEQVDRLAHRIARFHDAAEIVQSDATQDAACRAFAPVQAVLSQLKAVRAAQTLAPIEAWLQDRQRVLAPVMRERHARGAVRDGHGDLHLSNTVILGDEVTAFDCIEFDPSLRRIDVMSDVAFLTMDLKARERADLAARFLDGYLEGRGDYEGLRLLRFHEVQRALVRDLVASLRPAATSSGGPDYLALAQRLIRAADEAPRLAIVCGLAGTGKSTLARELVQRTGAVRVRSDVERKRLFGLSVLERSGHIEGGIYDEATSARTYARLADCARCALAGGYAVVVDAAFLSHAQRRAFRALAQEQGVAFTIFALHADDAVLRARVRDRFTAGSDASEADLRVLDLQARLREPFEPCELGDVIHVDSGQALDAAGLAGRWMGTAGR
jgi:aminoglycoside phosphotransferase family enzyme/predicted kinase